MESVPKSKSSKSENIPVEFPEDILPDKNNSNDSFGILGGREKQLLRRNVNQFRRYIKNYFNGKYVFGLRINNDDLFQLQQQLKNSSCLTKGIDSGLKTETNQVLRDKICLNLKGNSFLTFLQDMIPHQIPSIYI